MHITAATVLGVGSSAESRGKHKSGVGSNPPSLSDAEGRERGKSPREKEERGLRAGLQGWCLFEVLLAVGLG